MQNFLDTSTGFSGANSIFDVPRSPSLAFGREIFNTPTFLVGLTLGKGGTTVDEGAWPVLAFAFLAASFFAT
jgi:hypothetical protein